MPTAPKTYSPFRRDDVPEHRPAERRGTRHERGYDEKWTRVRNMHIAKNPLCVRCGKLAVEVDHIIPVRQRPDLRLRMDNLQSLCKPCHGQKSEEDKRRYGLPLD